MERIRCPELAVVWAQYSEWLASNFGIGTGNSDFDQIYDARPVFVSIYIIYLVLTIPIGTLAGKSLVMSHFTSAIINCTTISKEYVLLHEKFVQLISNWYDFAYLPKHIFKYSFPFAPWYQVQVIFRAKVPKLLAV